ncbi:putative DNA-binding transcriptional regulator YafY [Tamaricihabitans halophyticus]|uniref:Putative DNA-binding transcriptional regulator YafY n=1 Tax=Tamaricihabitans halophyticus TaxID=1262583 RepID=A0A4R2QYT4_9PSEU|nr:YafY family protein [Tamaricihabitans halophyticus]TCP54379.1 putative DNA-binding transcriptional regulator YafY [Tamaricihabitans halophyticus]
MASTTPTRLLRLLSLLSTRREWSGAELAERLAVTGRTVRRDIDRLRALGYPVRGTTGTAGGYRLAPGKELPPLLLEDAEAIAVAVGLRTSAGSNVAGIAEPSIRALAKLEQVLPKRLRSRLRAFDEVSARTEPAPVPPAESSTLAVLATACRDQEIVSFEYRARTGGSSKRRVQPHRVLGRHGRWYLIAYDPERADWRAFRVDRVRDPLPTGARCGPLEPPDGDAARFLARKVTSAPYRHAARATIDAPAATILARLPQLIPDRVTPLDAHRCEVQLGADSIELIAQQLIATGAQFTLDASPEVRERLRAIAARLAAVANPPM